MSEVTGKNNRDIIRIVLIVILIGVVVGGGYKINEDSKERKALQTEYDLTRETLTTKLDSISVELSGRISEISELGGNIDSLIILKDSITAERDQLQRTRVANKALIQRLDRKVNGYEELLLAKDEEIVQLKKLNNDLLEENNVLKVDKNELNQSLTEAAQREEAYKQRISLAAKHRAENIQIFNINSRGKEREGNFRKRQAQKIKVTFNLAPNDVAPVAGHQILIQLVDPLGNVIFDVARGSGSFKIDGREEFYTAMQEIVFDNSKQELSFVYDKGSEFDAGDYKIIILADTYEIGQSSFNVR
ncbi:chromosome segregation protein SMC [Roseivirga sp. E12]|uniref:chromosome segregation protein SMC n=1 Tax=Roseivirga sp. E12 TaxID=2819237 RepID=UPI001ABCC69B|nr:chromosome segregation protein SMC [Roseivirga sp. E12]MBO3698345.1 chromosome segregation protein SMC [Roseivirga sp. E12]